MILVAFQPVLSSQDAIDATAKQVPHGIPAAFRDSSRFVGELMNNTDVELYGMEYEGYLWANVSGLSLFGIAGLMDEGPGDTGIPWLLVLVAAMAAILLIAIAIMVRERNARSDHDAGPRGRLRRSREEQPSFLAECDMQTWLTGTTLSTGISEDRVCPVEPRPHVSAATGGTKVNLIRS